MFVWSTQAGTPARASAPFHPTAPLYLDPNLSFNPRPTHPSLLAAPLLQPITIQQNLDAEVASQQLFLLQQAQVWAIATQFALQLQQHMQQYPAQLLPGQQQVMVAAAAVMEQLHLAPPAPLMPPVVAAAAAEAAAAPIQPLCQLDDDSDDEEEDEEEMQESGESHDESNDDGEDDADSASDSFGAASGCGHGHRHGHGHGHGSDSDDGIADAYGRGRRRRRPDSRSAGTFGGIWCRVHLWCT